MTWIAFRNFTEDRFEFNQRILVGKLFTIYQNSKSSPIQLEFFKPWLQRNKLVQIAPAEEPAIKPTIGLCYEALFKYYPNEPTDIPAIFGRLISKIDEFLTSSNTHFEIDLKFFGKILRADKSLSFVSYSLEAEPGLYRLPKVKTLIKRQAVKENNQIRVELPKIKTFTLKQDQALDILLNQDTTNYQHRKPQFNDAPALGGNGSEKVGTIAKDFNQLNSHQFEAKDKGKTKSNFRLKKTHGSALNNFNYQKGQSINDTLPLSYNNALMFNNTKTAEQIFTAKIQPPIFGPPKMPKILDEHSQTKATPLALVFNSHSASARIAVNYTPLCKYIHLDINRKRISILYNNENNIFYSANGLAHTALANKQTSPLESKSNENLNNPAQVKNSHFYLKNKFGTEKIPIEQQKQESIFYDEQRQRYDKFIKEVIRDDEVVNFPQLMLAKIKSEIKSTYSYLSHESIASTLENLFAEIQYDFKFSLKKGVLDYILMEKEERERLNLDLIDTTSFKEKQNIPIDCKIQKGLIDQIRNDLRKNLLLFSKATNSIINCWIPLENALLCNLAIPSAGLTMHQFLEQQRTAITAQHTVITSSWIKKISDIYKSHSETLNKKEVKIFFKAMGKVISSQIRGMVEKTLTAQRTFFSQFDIPNSPTIQEALEAYYSPIATSYPYFLIIKAIEENKIITLESNFQTVLNEIIDILKDTIKSSENIARPENFFYRLEKSSLDPVLLSEPIVEETMNYITDIITMNFEMIQDFESVFEKYCYLFSEKENLSRMLDGTVSQVQLIETFIGYKKLEKELIYSFPSEIPMNMIKIDLKDMKECLLQITRQLKGTVTDYVAKEITNISSKIIKSLKSAFDGICTRIETVEKLIEAESWIENFLRVELLNLQESYQEMLSWLHRMLPHYAFSMDNFRLINETKQCLIDYTEKIEREKIRVMQEREGFDKRLIAKRGVVVQKGSDLHSKVEGFKKEGRLFWMDRILSEIAEVKQGLQDTFAEIHLINHEEQLLGYAKSEFLMIDQCSKSLTMLETFWNSIFEWTNELKKCESTVIFKLEIDKIEDRISRICSNIYMSIIEFKSMSLPTTDPINLADKILNEIEIFKNDFRLVKYICNEGLRGRHWRQINDYLAENRLDIRLEPNGVYYMSTLKDMNLHYLEQGLAEICETASKEFANEKLLTKIEKFLDQTVIELKPYKEFADVFVFTTTHIEDLFSTLVDHLQRVQAMKTSKYAEVFKEQLFEIETRLSVGKDVIQLWKNLQTQWIYLEPIFMSEDINKSLPHESMKFKETNSDLRLFLSQRRRDPSLKNICKDPELSSSLSKMLESLQNIDKNLENYLDKKRNVFPRFYFLSSQALIELLSSSKNPERIQKFLKILFEGISKFNFNEEGHISEIVSSEGEVIHLKQTIDISSYRGYIERWLSDLEIFMVNEMKRAIISGLQDFGLKSKENFIKGRISQACVNAFMTAWTFETENAIGSGASALEEHYKEMQLTLNELIDIQNSELNFLDRRTVETLLIITAHNRDIVAYLIEQGLDKVEDYAWQSQMRYYWEQTGILENDNSKVQLMFNVLTYGYEYYGNTQRLVITPVTDRCFRSIVVAMNLKFGTILEGPAATGKSETIKDLSRALARCLVIYNCSESIDYKSVDRIIKGLACTGGWCCFDEFNRLDLEVLSVISQHLLKIKTAFTEQKAEFFFEGSLIKFKGSCSWFATVNPGYSNRRDLPESLRLIFRPVTIVEPDSHKIAEVKLFAAGFQNAAELAFKLYHICDHCKSLIPDKLHYDFSLRTVITIIMAAKEIKSSYPEIDEEMILCKAICQIIRPKLSTKDHSIFKTILKNFFGCDDNLQDLCSNSKVEEYLKALLPEINKELRLKHTENRELTIVMDSNDKEPQGAFNQSILRDAPTLDAQNIPEEPIVTCLPNDCYANTYIDSSDYFIQKVIEIHTFMRLQPGIILLGDTLTGKSTAFSVCLNMFPSSDVRYLNPKTTSSIELFGSMDITSNEWTNGILSILIKNLISSGSELQRKVLLLDGRIESEWIESMNTLLDESRKLSLGNGDIHHFSSNFNVVFETDSLDSASPATISRCGIVFFQSTEFGWKTLLNSWLSSMDFLTQTETDKITIFFSTIFEPFYNICKSMRTIIGLSANQIFLSMKTIANSLLKVFENINPENNSMEVKEKIAIIDQIMIFSIVWAVGTTIHDSSRKNFDLTLKKVSQTADRNLSSDLSRQFRKVQLPETGSLFDYQLIVKNFDSKDKSMIISEWQKWSFAVDSIDSAPSDKDIFQIVVPTIDRIRYEYLTDVVLNSTLQNILLCGPPATGKTLLLNSIKSKLRTAKTHLIETSFCFTTGANSFCALLDQQYIRKIGTRYFVPIQDKENFIITIEDLNMCSKDESNSQSALELLRYIFETKSYYDINDKAKVFKLVSSFRTIGTLTTSSQSSDPLPARLLSKFFTLALNEFDDDQHIQIYTKILNYKNSESSSENFVSKIPKMATASLEMLKEMRKKFIPVPPKPHYYFDLRTGLRLISGLLLTKKEGSRESESVLKLWTHECIRTFMDQLISIEDRTVMLNEVLKPVFLKSFNINFDSVFGFLDTDLDGSIKTYSEIKRLVFGNLSPSDQPQSQPYAELPYIEKTKITLKSFLDEYNSLKKQPLNITLFTMAVEQLLIMNRTFYLPNGGSLLVGSPGVGRQSLLRFSSYLNASEYCELNGPLLLTCDDILREFKPLIVKALQNTDSTLAFNEEQLLKNPQLLNAINGLVNFQNMSTLFTEDELMTLISTETQDELLNLEELMARAKKRIHIFILLTSNGKIMKTISRYYPSILSSLSVQWFLEWPREAFFEVAVSKMESTEVIKEYNQESIIDILIKCHHATNQIIEEFASANGSRHLISNFKFFACIEKFKAIFESHSKEVNKRITNYKRGQEMIEKAETVVSELKSKLDEIQSEILEQTSKIEELLVDIDKRKKEADERQKVVSNEEVYIKEQTSKLQAISSECQADIDILKEELDRAQEIISKVTKNEIEDLRQLKNPPPPIQYTLQALSIILGTKVEVKKDVNTSRMQPDWVLTSRKTLNDLEISTLMNFNNEKEMDEAKFSKLDALFNDPRTKDVLEENAIRFSSNLAAGMFLWIKGQMGLYTLNLKLAPKREFLKTTGDELNVLKKELASKQTELNAINEEIKELNSMFLISRTKKSSLERDYTNCVLKSERAEKLISCLPDEKERWRSAQLALEAEKEEILGTVIFSALFLTYFGPLDPVFREKLHSAIHKLLVDEKIIRTEFVFDAQKSLSNPVQIREYSLKGLLDNKFYYESAIIAEHSSSQTLFIDPHSQLSEWINNCYKNAPLMTTKFSDKSWMTKIINAMTLGAPLLIQDADAIPDTDFDHIFKPLINFNKTKQTIMIYDKVVELNQSFKLILVARTMNLSFSTSSLSHLQIINFDITQEALTEQIITLMMKKERRELEAHYNEKQTENYKISIDIQKSEEKLMEILQNDQQNILEEENLVDLLATTSTSAKRLSQKQAQILLKESEIKVNRNTFSKLAKQCSALFLAISDLKKIHPIYVFSLKQFISILSSTFDYVQSERNEQFLNFNTLHLFVQNLYLVVSRMLFNADKVIFGFLMYLNLEKVNGMTHKQVELVEWLTQDKLNNDIAHNVTQPNEKSPISFVSDLTWKEIKHLASVCSSFAELPNQIRNNPSVFEPYPSNCPDIFELLVPEAYRENLSPIETLILKKVLSPERFSTLLKTFLADNLNIDFDEDEALDLKSIVMDVAPITPVIFITSSLKDPTQELCRIADKNGIMMEILSLGQGQKEFSFRLVEESIKLGHWLLFQNCHLAKKFWSLLNKKLEELKTDVEILHKGFRILLVTYSTEDIPKELLVDACKIVMEPPLQFKRNVSSAMNIDLLKNSEFFENFHKKRMLQQLSTSLCFLHAILTERKNYPGIGWTSNYNFNDSDLNIIFRNVHGILNRERKTADLPKALISNFILECVYGSRIHNKKDRKIVEVILSEFLNSESLNQNQLSLLKENLAGEDENRYTISDLKNRNKVLEFIEKLPEQVPSSIYSLNGNAVFANQLSYASILQAKLGLFSLNSANHLQSTPIDYQKLSLNIKDIIKILPLPIDVAQFTKKFALINNDPINYILHQEVELLNTLIAAIKRSFEEIIKICNGSRLSNDEYDMIISCIHNEKIPDAWKTAASLSTKSIAGFLKNITQRVKQINSWIINGSINFCWLNSLFKPQSFLLAFKMSQAKKYDVPINELSYEFDIISPENQLDKPNEGEIILMGLYLRNAQIDYADLQIVDPNPKTLFFDNVRLKMSIKHVESCPNTTYYPCSLFRRNTITNPQEGQYQASEELCEVRLPCSGHSDKWLKTGVALFCEIED